MNKEVEQAMEKLKDHYLQIYNGKIELVDKELFDIIKQAFSDMEEERKDRDETEQSLSKWIVELQTEIKEATNIQADSYKWINELQAKLDKIKEVIPKVINGLLGYEIDLNTVIPILEKILKEE